jgi:hypothetical protein
MFPFGFSNPFKHFSLQAGILDGITFVLVSKIIECKQITKTLGNKSFDSFHNNHDPP